VRQHRYQAIADDLRHRVEAGEFAAGRLLPSEAALSAAYSASRVTVRKALEALRDDGLIAARQGFGWFVAADLLRQHLGRLGTIEAQLAESGIDSERRVLDFRFVAAPPEARRVLGSRSVLEVRRVNLARGQPFARVTVWCPERLAARLSRADVETTTFYELLELPLGGATQTIAAGLASVEDAEVLDVPAGSPVLVCKRVTRSGDDEPVLFSEHVFPAHLTEFEVELPRAEASMAPTGLRLVHSRAAIGGQSTNARTAR
jgi:DNA-binding GntR family transcriptional regulator